VERYLPQRVGAGQSARGVLGGVRRRLAKVARRVGRPDLAAVFAHLDGERLREAKTVADAIRVLRPARVPVPQISADIGLWLPARAIAILRAHGIATLADLTVRIPRQRQWWKAIPGFGVASARRIEGFFAAHPELTGRARALIAVSPASSIVPWEQLRLPHEVDGSAGAYRAPRERWVGPVRPRGTPDWRLFSGSLSARSAAYALSVLGALFRWLIGQRYLLANPFAGVKVRGSARAGALDTSYVFTEGNGC